MTLFQLQFRANHELIHVSILYIRAHTSFRVPKIKIFCGEGEGKRKGAGEKIIRIEDLIRFLKFENPAAGNVSKEGGRKW